MCADTSRKPGLPLQADPAATPHAARGLLGCAYLDFAPTKRWMGAWLQLAPPGPPATPLAPQVRVFGLPP